MTTLRTCFVVMLLAGAAYSIAQTTASPKSYLAKLSVSVSAKESKPGDRIRAAIISPESLLNGYLEGTVQEVATKPNGRLVLRFTNLLYKGKSTPIQVEVVEIVNSKGHKSVDDSERPVRIESGALLSSGPQLWFDEGSELRVASR